MCDSFIAFLNKLHTVHCHHCAERETARHPILQNPFNPISFAPPPSLSDFYSLSEKRKRKSNPNTKLIFFHPSLPKQASSTILATHRLWLLFSFFTLVFTVTLFNTTITFSSSSALAKNSATSGSIDPLHSSVAKALLHYVASSNFTTTNKAMSSVEIISIATALLQSPKPNFLIFSLTHETLLWFALNQHGRTVFIDENEYFISKFEQT